VLLLTDFNSRIPVLVEPSRDQAILAGNNTRRPSLVFLPLNPRLSVGDRVLTSGRGGVLPPGLEVGTVTAIDDTGVTVEPLVDFARLEYLRLIEYGRVLPPEQLEQLQQEIFGPPPPPGFVTSGAAPSPDPVIGPLDPPVPASGSAP
jgi:rod shape-determining protein MreC